MQSQALKLWSTGAGNESRAHSDTTFRDRPCKSHCCDSLRTKRDFKNWWLATHLPLLFLVTFFSFYFIFIVDTITDVPISHPPFPTSTQPLPPFPSANHHTVVYVYGSCIYDLWLIPSPSFIHSPTPPL